MVANPKFIKYLRCIVTSLAIKNICVFHARSGAPKGIIVVKVEMPMGNKRCKIIVHNVNAGQYATGRPDVIFVAWKTNVANAK